jgi:hypothetical protein
LDLETGRMAVRRSVIELSDEFDCGVVTGPAA